MATPGENGCTRAPVALHRPRPFAGEVPEWSNGAVSKTVVPLRAPRVRIPVSPPYSLTPGFGVQAPALTPPGRKTGPRRCGPDAGFASFPECKGLHFQ